MAPVQFRTWSAEFRGLPEKLQRRPIVKEMVSVTLQKRVNLNWRLVGGF